MKKYLFVLLMCCLVIPSNVGITDGKRLKFPANVDTITEKFEYIHRCYERLRLLHNVLGYWYIHGITEDEYDNGVTLIDLQYPTGTVFVRIPNLIKNRINGGLYKPQLTEHEWQTFLNKIFDPLMMLIDRQYVRYKIWLRQQTTFNPNFDDFVEDDI